MPRFHVDLPLSEGLDTALPAAAARHVQVLRMQPGQALTVFDGHGGEWQATVSTMGRSAVTVRIGAQVHVDRELAVAVTLAIGMPANDRMDALIEKATELGVTALQPLACERSVLRLNGDRADKRLAHWRGIAAAAAEQCGRTRLPTLHAVQRLADWLPTASQDRGAVPCMLSLGSPCQTFGDVLRDLIGSAAKAGPRPAVTFVSGPEGGLSPAEEAQARSLGFLPVSLGPRVLRADTAPLAALAAVAALIA